jgi:hypothetical protein
MGWNRPTYDPDSVVEHPAEAAPNLYRRLEALLEYWSVATRTCASFRVPDLMLGANVVTRTWRDELQLKNQAEDIAGDLHGRFDDLGAWWERHPGW